MANRKKQEKNEQGLRPWLVFDKETDSFDGLPVKPFCWAWRASTGDRGCTWNREEFWDMIKNFDGIALAHNGGKFDIVLAADKFEAGEIKIINGRVAETKIGLCTLRDSFLIIPAPLKAGGGKMEFDYHIFDRDKKHLRKKHAALIEQYINADCDALYELVDRFYTLYGQRLTQAGAALAEWEKMGGLVRRWGGAHDTQWRQFYYGGRCEAFQKGALGDGWEYYDIKSSYPNAMQYEHPACHLSDYFAHSDIKKITPQSFARIIAANHGCLPSRGKYSTDYPHHDDPREYFATGWEILAGLETNTLKVFSATIWRPNMLESLKPYTDRFYAEKLDAEKRGNKVDRTIAKIFQNSLYGKYGSAAGDYKKFMLVPAGENCHCAEYKKIQPEHFKNCPWGLHAEIDELDIIQAPNAGQFYDVALSASITGFARAYLFRQMMKCDNIAYSDTDSIICKNSDHTFDVGENIGQWEKVCTMSDFHVAGKKLYAGKDEQGEWVTAHKGFSALDTGHADVIRAALGFEIKIMRAAPSINCTGEQNFINRSMRRT